MADIQVDTLAAALAKSFDMRDEAEGKIRQTNKPSLVSPFNPTGGVKPKLRRETFFCGAIQQEESLKAEEIELFNSLKPGHYNKGKWQVLGTEDPTGVSRVDVRVPVNDINALMDLPNSLVGILSQIATEAEASTPRKSK